MREKSVKVPGPDHPITIERNPNRVVVTVGGKAIADTTEALVLREAHYPSVQYIPRKDVDMAALERSATRTYCPYKGEANYYHLGVGDETIDDAIWTYEQPYPAVAQIAGHVAFYPDKADVAVS